MAVPGIVPGTDTMLHCAAVAGVRMVVAVSARVMIVGLPPLVSDVLAAACTCEGRLEVVAVVPQGIAVGEPDVELAVMAHDPDVLIVAAEATSLAEIEALRLHQCARLVVGVSSDGAEAWVVELRAEAAPIEPASFDAIRDAICVATGSGPG